MEIIKAVNFLAHCHQSVEVKQKKLNCKIILQAGMIAAHGILGKRCVLQTNPKHMVPSWKELGARIFVTRFLSYYVNTGCLT